MVLRCLLPNRIHDVWAKCFSNEIETRNVQWWCERSTKFNARSRPWFSHFKWTRFTLVLLRGCVNIVRYILEIGTKLTQYILTKAIPNIINVHVLWKVTGGGDENITLVMEHAAMNGNSTLMLWFLSMDTPGNAPHNEHGIWSTIITLYHRYRIQGSYRDTCYDDCTECAINEVENMREMERASL